MSRADSSPPLSAAGSLRRRSGSRPPARSRSRSARKARTWTVYARRSASLSATGGGADEIEQAQHRDRVGPDDVVGLLDRRLQGDRAREALGDVLDGDRLQPLQAAADHRDDRIAANETGQQVHELVAASVDDRGAE